MNDFKPKKLNISFEITIKNEIEQLSFNSILKNDSCVFIDCNKCPLQCTAGCRSQTILSEMTITDITKVKNEQF